MRRDNSSTAAKLQQVSGPRLVDSTVDPYGRLPMFVLLGFAAVAAWLADVLGRRR